jgi:hypothetical protein
MMSQVIERGTGTRAALGDRPGPGETIERTIRNVLGGLFGG